MQGLGIIIELLMFVVDHQFAKEVTQKDIENNIEKLKKYPWFQDYLKNGQYRELITHHKDVRHRIGKFKTEKLDHVHYNAKCHGKLEKVLERYN
ncbi:hypothetical protein [Salimicrobium flavidum]|uniref:Uncharacterized protein n=1 Tax=Salimicrobium flavidum TaxID=570947 RepID=A0A1N7KD73_9BACI|nr:hypothetical protein [Salimicrobium flavidum]SIS59404.1 hypothetical protein SAMN05421687_11054 [Salimicrobium flavidum]